MIMSKIAGVVILYDLDDNLERNVCSYCDELDKLYIFDNKPNEKSVWYVQRLKDRYFSKIEYITDNINHGIAYALNHILGKVYGEYDWLLTMDQDSYFMEGTFKNYIKVLDYINYDKVYGISPARIKDDIHNNKLLSKIETCITSGNIVNVKIANEVGGYDERLFIDEVDGDFCWKCNSYGYYLLRYQKLILNHKLGHPMKKTICGKTFCSTNESPIRMYYIFRNALYVSKKYKFIRYEKIKQLINWMGKIIVVDNNKVSKLYYCFKGIVDFIIGKTGKILF